MQAARLRAASTEAHLMDAIKRFGERTQGIYGEIHPGQRVPSPPLRDEDYSGPPRMTLDAIFAPRRSGETDAAFADRQQRRQQFLDDQGVLNARRERDARAQAIWAEIAQRYGFPSEPPSTNAAGGGMGGGPPGGGPPDGDGDRNGGSDDEDGPPDEDNRDERPPSPASIRRARRQFTRSPTYMPERPAQADYTHVRRAPADPYDPEYDDSFTRESLRNIRGMIAAKLGTQLPENAAIKNIKNLPQPDKYGGEDDLEVFESWLKTLLRWMRIMRLGGPTLDEERVQLLGQFLKSKASEWFNDTIDSTLVRGPPWTFTDAICALFE